MNPTPHDSERKFHDAWASNTPLESRHVVASFEATTAPEGRAIMRLIGDARGKKILDVGCGLGEASAYFALQGASVTAYDLSPKMVETTEALAKKMGTSVRGVVGAAEKIALEDNSFDFVYLGNLVHHVHEREGLWRQVHRLLKVGGKLISWDPIKYNPVINVYRAIATETRTPDERPLGRDDILEVKKVFNNVQYEMFWLSSLMIFIKYALWNRYHPNRVRYWKKILEEPEKNVGWLRLLQAADHILLKIPGIRWLGWNILISAEKK